MSWRGGYGQSGCCLKHLNPPLFSLFYANIYHSAAASVATPLSDAKISVFFVVSHL